MSCSNKEVLEREFKWLLEKEYSQRVEALNTKLQDCNKRFSDAKNSTGDLRPILINHGDAVLCTAAVEGDKIVKAEVNLKLPGKGNKPIRTTIKEHHPWKLKQIQDCANYVKKAQDQLEQLVRSKSSLGETEEIVVPEKESTKGPTEIRKVFSRLIDLLRKAESALTLPQAITALQIYSAEQKAMLKPALPEDIVLHFHISSAMLVLTILTITHAHKGHSPSGKTSPDGTGACWLGTSFELGSNVYEVSHQMQVQSLIPWLSGVLQLIQGMLELAQDFTDKVKLFEGTELRSS